MVSTGVITFAALMLLLLGSLHALSGFLALLRGRSYVVAAPACIVDVDYTGWGIVHLGIGVRW